MKPEKQKRLKICLLVGEYFGAMGTLYGGFGFLARHIVAKLISKYSEIDVEVCLGKRQDRKFSFARYMAPKEEIVDDVRVFRLPRRDREGDGTACARIDASRAGCFRSRRASELYFLRGQG